MNNNFLESFGFGDKEYELYYLLVTRGPLTISELVTASTFHRPYVYKIIVELINKKVVRISQKDNKKRYIAEPPSLLKQLIVDQQQKISEKLDDLEEVYVAPHLETKVTTHQGKKGITAMFADLINSQKKGDIFYRYTSEKDTEYANTFLPKDYRLLRDKKQLERFVISNSDVASTKQKRLERATKIIPKGEVDFKHDCIQLIYANKVSFINLSKVQGVIIEDESMAQFQREIFKLLYKRL